QTLALFFAGFLLLVVLGFPVVRLALPRDVYEEYGHLLAAPVGYMLLCLFAFGLSGGAHVPAALASWIVAAILALSTAGILVRDRAALTRSRWLGRAREVAWLVAPLVLLLLWPLFVYGADTYLAAVNPDYFAGLVDDYFLLKGHSVADFSKGKDTYFPIDYLAGSISSSGRFASGLLALVLAKLFAIEIRTALSLSIALFLSCLPLALFFFSRVVLGFDRATARVSGWLIAISAPIAMSYLYYYLGQNSGLAALPLTMAAGYLLLERPSWRLLVFFALLVNALLVVYLGMLPYALAPLGVFGLYVLATRRLPVARLLAIAAGFVAISIVVNIGMLQSLYGMVRGWGNVIGQTLQGQYFVDFLTEAFVPYFLGIIVYPGSTSYIPALRGIFTVGAITIIVGLWLLLVFALWLRDTRDRGRKLTVAAAIFIYFVVWWVYCFQRQYGYAVFKMSSWLQFMLVPFAAYGWHLVRGGPTLGLVPWKKALLGLGLALYVVTNFLATIEYGIKALGRDPINGFIVNNYEMSGNRDYFELSRAIGEHVKPDQSVGLAFVDSIQNFWVAYYLRDHRISLMSHENIPGDDENLPDIHTNKVVDYYGNVREANNVFAHGASDDYYLTWNVDHLNRDIVNPHFSAPPVWQDHTFRLFRASENPGMIYTGRGFYRVEFSGPKPYWWPEPARWTAQGGEVYLQHPTPAGAPYQVAFDAVVGFEDPSDRRTVELWVNKVKFDEVVIDSTRRYISKPFVPTDELDKIVIKVRERVPPTKRPLPLWNKHVPLDYRQLNLLLANIHVTHAGDAIPREGPPCGRLFERNELFRCAITFNGVQIDHWIGKHAELALPADASVQKVRLKGYAPANLGFKFPYRIDFRVNGEPIAYDLAKPGDFTIDLPAKPQSGAIAVEMVPSESHDLKEEYAFRHKVVTQAFRLDSVELQ
ncbi:MAG: hypothetical protein ACM3X5_09200, partial [Bacillota bacterium]